MYRISLFDHLVDDGAASIGHAGRDTRGHGVRRAFAHPTLLRLAAAKISTTAGLQGGTRKRCYAFSPPGETSAECECVMKDELTTIQDATRAAQAELADYLVSADRNAELTIAKLVGILDRRDVVRAMRLLRASERRTGPPQRALAEAS